LKSDSCEPLWTLDSLISCSACIRCITW
jgi:hypothetical protein